MKLKFICKCGAAQADDRQAPRAPQLCTTVCLKPCHIYAAALVYTKQILQPVTKPKPTGIIARHGRSARAQQDICCVPRTATITALLPLLNLTRTAGSWVGQGIFHPSFVLDSAQIGQGKTSSPFWLGDMQTVSFNPHHCTLPFQVSAPPTQLHLLEKCSLAFWAAPSRLC